jgi:hypothetical protein
MVANATALTAEINQISALIKPIKLQHQFSLNPSYPGAIRLTPCTEAENACIPSFSNCCF